MKLLKTGKKIAKNKHGQNVPQLKITQVIEVNRNLDSNIYQRNSTVLYAFVLNKLSVQPSNFILLKTQSFIMSRFRLLTKILTLLK